MLNFKSSPFGLIAKSNEMATAASLLSLSRPQRAHYERLQDRGRLCAN
jgi:hypothetical protein